MYKPTIGLEIHAELNTKSKMFCSCKNDPDEKRPNFNVCPICLGHPGTLPVINKEAVRKVIKTGLALNCEIPANSKFDRKNYFYPDLPKGYQISQYDMPLCVNGYLDINKFVLSARDSASKIAGKKIRIRRVHLEEDTGRLSHPANADYSLVDFNRAGVPLMELVTEPDIASAKEARIFGQELQIILRYLGVSTADMEKGQFRVEVNISLSEDGEKLGTKVEIKNLNSFRVVEKALEYEIERQRELLESGKKVVQETRGWHDAKEITFSQREKEEAQDYRYFPEPDLSPLSHSADFLNSIKAEIPELPQQRRERLQKEYALGSAETEIFVSNKALGEYFEKVVSELPSGLSGQDLSELTKKAANYLITDLQGLLNGRLISGNNFLITPENFSEFIFLVYKGKISSKSAKIILSEMFQTGADPSNIIEEKELIPMEDESEIEEIIKEIIAVNLKPVEDFKKGKASALQFLIGQAMAKTKGKANPATVEKILQCLLTK